MTEPVWVSPWFASNWLAAMPKSVSFTWPVPVMSTLPGLHVAVDHAAAVGEGERVGELGGDAGRGAPPGSGPRRG